MDILVLVGRILFAAIFLFSALGHFTQIQAMAGYTRSKGIPAPEAAVVGSGVVLAAGGLMVLLGLWGDLGALLLLVFLVPTALLFHRFWQESDPMARQQEMIQFMKDLALAGGAVLLFALFAYAGDDLGLTLTGPLFDLR